jgi:hypothetical protein
MFRKNAYFLLFLALFVGFSSATFGQLNQETFGKNRIQYRQFEWKVFVSDNFEVHFYEGGDRIARLAIDYLEGEFDRITDLLGYPPYNKTRIFLYTSYNDLRQSNIGLADDQYNLTGELVSNRGYVEIAYDGENQNFKEKLTFEVSKHFINEMLFGGNFTDFFQNAFYLSLSEWFIEGAALYVAKGWDLSMDDYMRSLVLSGKTRRINRLSGEEAGIAGQSVWNFIANRYGVRNISNILNLTRIIRNEEEAVSKTLGTNFRRFQNDWMSYYGGSAQAVKESYTIPSDEFLVSSRNKQEFGNQVRFNQGASKLAYTVLSNGRYQVMVQDVSSGKSTTVLSGGFNALEQAYNKQLPLLAWQSEEVLAVIEEIKGKQILNLVNLSGKVQEQIELPQFNQINDFSFAPDGSRIVISGETNGQSDIFLFIPSRNFLRRLTNDVFDNIQPRFIPGTNSLVFSSNRSNDSLNINARKLEELRDFYNLYIYNLDSTSTRLGRITNTLSRDYNPVPVSAREILFTSDVRGIQNLYKLDLETGVSTQISNLAVGLRYFDAYPRGGKLAWIGWHKGDKNLFVQAFDFNQNFFSPLTPRQQTLQARFIANRLMDPPGAVDNLDEQVEERKEVEAVTEQKPAVASGLKARPGEKVIDTENYIFDQEDLRVDERPQTSALTALRSRAQRSASVLGPYEFDPKFAIDNFQVEFMVDPLRGFGPKVQTKLNDVLENHSFNAGFYTALEFSNGGNLFAEYSFKKLRPDFSIRYERTSLKRESNEIIHRYFLDKVEALVSYPFSNSARFSVGPIWGQTRFFDQDPRLLSPSLPPGLPATQSENNYYGGQAELVFDNTIIHGVNLLEGTRAKANFTQYEGVENSSLSFGRLKVDVRHYIRLHQDITFAGRGIYGRFMGNSPKRFLLGGVDNWMFNRTNDSDGDGNQDPLDNVPFRDNSNILFHEFITNVRGYDFNTFNGTDVLSFNAEIRWPIVKYFYKGPVASNFLRNFQLVGFYDIGSSWSDGKSPFTEQSSQTIELIRTPGSPFQATINNFGNPWIQSYGTGIRTVLMGYFLRFDLAWPVEDYRTSQPRFFFSLGYDF